MVLAQNRAMEQDREPGVGGAPKHIHSNNFQQVN